MNLALAHGMTRDGFGFARTVRKLPYAAFTVVVAAVVVCGLAIANMPSRRSAGPAAPVAMDDASPAAAAERVAAPSTRTRCIGCGVVESIRALDATGGAPAQFEFTVRLRDGSARVSRSTGRGNWLAGDRIILMAGAGGARD